MQFIQDHIEGIDWESVLAGGAQILFIFFLGWIARRLAASVLRNAEARLVRRYSAEGEAPTEATKRVETLMRLVRQAARLSIWIIVLLVVLRELGVEIGPILASAGILGLAVGFGAQNLVRDVISGFFFLLENQVRVGDVAVVNGTGGLVEGLSFRTIVLRDLSGTVHVFPNGAVETLSNLTRGWSAYVFDVGVAYKEDTDHVTEIIRDTLDKMKTDAKIGPLIIDEPEIFGVDKLGDSAVTIKGRIKTKPIKQWEVGRAFLRRVKQALDQNGVEIPFPHQTVYFGEASPPFDVKLLEKLSAPAN